MVPFYNAGDRVVWCQSVPKDGHLERPADGGARNMLYHAPSLPYRGGYLAVNSSAALHRYSFFR